MALTKETLILKPNFENIPEEMKQLPQWVLWRAEPNRDNPNKLDKHPYQPSGRMAATNRKNEWSTFQEVEKAFGTGEFDGIGFVFSEDDPYIGLDIDGENLDKLSVIAQSLTALSYTEVSPSGKGLHVIFKGKLPAGANNRKSNLEIYEKGRYFSFTGAVITDKPILNQQSILDAVIKRHFGFKKDFKTILSNDVQPFKITNTELWARMFKSKNGGKIKALFNGEYGNDHSAADQALCNHLAFWTQKNAAQIDSMFRETALIRDKWDKIHHSNGQTYGQGTIERAISDCTEVYNPQKDKIQIHILDDKPQFKLNFRGKDFEVSPGIKKYESGIDSFNKWKAYAQRVGDWRANLEYFINDKNDTAILLKNGRNIELILENEMGEILVLDKFTSECVVKGELPWRNDEEKEWQTFDYNQLEHWFETKWNLKGKDMITNAFIHVVYKRGFHPVKEFIESVQWDGEIRVPTIFCDYLGAEHSKYVYEVTKRWFTGAVKRIYEPGCKFEIVPLLLGVKGLGKSEIGRRLAGGEWFTDSLKSLEPKIAGEVLANVWICEFPELKALKGKSDEEIKAFISSSDDVYRGAYERGKAVRHKRHTVFYGTSNKNEVLTDETGERRRFPIKCSKERKYNPFEDLTPEVIAQIWAESKTYYDEGYFTYIDQEVQELAEEIFLHHKDTDPLEGEVDEYVKRHGAVCIRQIWDDVMSDDQKKKPTRKDSNRIVSILTSLGYEDIGFNRFEKYGKQRIYGTSF